MISSARVFTKKKKYATFRYNTVEVENGLECHLCYQFALNENLLQTSCLLLICMLYKRFGIISVVHTFPNVQI